MECLAGRETELADLTEDAVPVREHLEARQRRAELRNRQTPDVSEIRRFHLVDQVGPLDKFLVGLTQSLGAHIGSHRCEPHDEVEHAPERPDDRRERALPREPADRVTLLDRPRLVVDLLDLGILPLRREREDPTDGAERLLDDARMRRERGELIRRECKSVADAVSARGLAVLHEEDADARVLGVAHVRRLVDACGAPVRLRELLRELPLSTRLSFVNMSSHLA